MKSYCLLLVVLCSAFIIQDVSAIKVKSNSTASVYAKTTANVFVPKKYNIAITPYSGIQAKDVGIGAEGTIWVTSPDSSSTLRLQPGSSSWEKVAGQGGSYISVDPNGNAWVVTPDSKVYKYTGSSWQNIGATAYDISCSAQGDVWHIGTNNGLYKLNSDGTSWRKVNGAAVNLAGGLHQSVWHLNGGKEIYRSVPDTWEQVTGEQATDIAIGAEGSVWVLTASANQLALYDEKKQQWIEVPLASYLAQSGSAANNSKIARIAAAPNGDVIGVRQDNSVFRLSFSYKN